MFHEHMCSCLSSTSKPVQATGVDMNAPEKNTKLSGFVFPRFGIVPVANIPINPLRNFCPRHGISWKDENGKTVRLSKLTKKAAADQIAAKLPLYETAAARGQGED